LTPPSSIKRRLRAGSMMNSGGRGQRYGTVGTALPFITTACRAFFRTDTSSATTTVNSGTARSSSIQNSETRSSTARNFTTQGRNPCSRRSTFSGSCSPGSILGALGIGSRCNWPRLLASQASPNATSGGLWAVTSAELALYVQVASWPDPKSVTDVPT
jgi:hypothetical protein